MRNSQKRILSMLHTAAVVAAAGLLAHCGAMGSDAMGEQRVTPDDGKDRLIEESDLYKVVGDWLYVQNPTTGLNVINVSNPSEPLLHKQVSDARGPAGELYVRGDRVYVLFKGMTGRCSLPPEMEVSWAQAPERSEAVVLVSAPSDPKVASRMCMPGDLVSSRIVGDVLYIVTSSYSTSTYEYTTWLFSIDVRDANHIGLADFRTLSGDAREVHVTTDAIFLAQASGGYTLVTYIDITDPEGAMQERGDLMVTGEPAGRFHMDYWNGMFRIVTFSGTWSGTNLHVIDTSDPDYMWLMGSYEGLAQNEELWATHFVEDKAYIVTYLRQDPYPRDPLWVVSLADPYMPLLEGELEIPGWSNFLYPRADKLVAVGRGDDGAHVAVSLFDVADPTSPAEIRRLEFGDSESTSEANLDFRGVRIIDDEAFGDPLITVPYTNALYVDGVCTPEHHLEIIDLGDEDITLRGNWKPSAGQQGLIRRTVPIASTLYVVSDRAVSTLDLTDRSDPWSPVSIDIAGSSFTEECPTIDFTIPVDDTEPVYSFFPFGCNVSGPTTSTSPFVLLAALALLLALRRRCR